MNTEDNTTSTFSRRRLLKLGTAAMVAGLPGRGQAKEKSEYLFGSYVRPWNRWDYKTALDGVAEAGFQYAGLMRTKEGHVVHANASPEKVREVAGAVKDRGLKTISLYGGQFGADRSLEEGIQGLRRLIDCCGLLDCPNLLLGGTGKEDVFDQYYKAVQENCGYAAERGVVITVKPHGGLNATGSQLKRIVERVNHKRFRVTYDPGNILHYSKGTADPVLETGPVAGLVHSMCVKDYDPHKSVNVTPGDGLVDFKKVLTALREGGFMGGPLILETVAPAETPAQATSEAKKALAFIKELVRAV